MVKVKENIEVLAVDRDYSAEDLCGALIGFHGFTDCDTVSSFAGKGKSKAFKSLLMERNNVTVFKSLGENETITEDLLYQLEHFVCTIYGGDGDDANELRYRSKQGKISCKDLPPCWYAVIEHCRRANYQSRVWRLALEAIPEEYSPIGHGWEYSLKEDGRRNLEIKWMSCKSAPDEVSFTYLFLHTTF